MSLRRLFSHLKRDRRGAAAVEFALIGPMVLASIVVVFALSAYFAAANALAAAIDEAARYANITPTATDTQIRSKFTASLLPGVAPNSVTLTITRAVVSPTINQVNLTASYPLTVQFVVAPAANLTISRSRSVYVPTA